MFRRTSLSKNLSSSVLSPGLLPASSNSARYSCRGHDQVCQYSVMARLSISAGHSSAAKDTVSQSPRLSAADHSSVIVSQSIRVKARHGPDPPPGEVVWCITSQNVPTATTPDDWQFPTLHKTGNRYVMRHHPKPTQPRHISQTPHPPSSSHL